jgi:hypothetical protein
MAKFRLSSASIFTIGGNAVPCPTSVSFDESVDDYISECAAQTVKAHVLGAMSVSGSFSGEVEADDVTELGYIAPSVTGALILEPAGNTVGNIVVSSSAFKITGRSLAFSSTGLSTYTCTFVMDNITIAGS